MKLLFILFIICGCNQQTEYAKTQIVEIEGCQYVISKAVNGDIRTIVHHEGCKNAIHKK